MRNGPSPRSAPPDGARALVRTAMLAAGVSSADSTLNAGSILVTMDAIEQKRPDTSPEALVRIGRIVTFGCMAFATAGTVRGLGGGRPPDLRAREDGPAGGLDGGS